MAEITARYVGFVPKAELRRIRMKCDSSPKPEQTTRHAFSVSPMAKPSKIEPVNIDLYEKAWAHRPQAQIKKKSRNKKKSRRRRKTKK
jgi:hypothetical protein